MKAIPPYGKRQGWVPANDEDFAGGGAYPEVPAVQFPLGLGRAAAGAARNALVLQTGADGRPLYEMIVTQHSSRLVTYSRPEHYRPTFADTADLAKPTEEEQSQLALQTTAALAEVAKLKAASNQVERAVASTRAQDTFVRYVPDTAAPGYNPACSERIIRVIEKKLDPLEPPKFKVRRAPPGRNSPPPPILRAPAKKLTAEDHAMWKLPPCVSNWKNQKGYTIPLDMRLQADGRGLQEVTVNSKFAQFSEALYVAERFARDEIKLKNDLLKQKKQLEEAKREEQLREIAAKARAERIERLGGVKAPPVQPASSDSDRPKRRSPSPRRRSPSPRRRSPSPRRRSPSPVRRAISPPRRRSISPSPRRRSESPPPEAQWVRRPSPPRRGREPSPPRLVRQEDVDRLPFDDEIPDMSNRRRSSSRRRVSVSSSPPAARRRSISRSASPRRRSRRDDSVSVSPPPRQRASRLSPPRRRRSPSPVQRRSPSPRRRSPSPRRRSPPPRRRRSPSPPRRRRRSDSSMSPPKRARHDQESNEPTLAARVELLERQRRREIERDFRLERAGRKRVRGDEDRDISERIALGQAQPTAQDGLYDARLFNRESGGPDITIADDDGYALYDKPLFGERNSNGGIYRMDKDRIRRNVGLRSVAALGDPVDSRGDNEPVKFERD